MARPQQVRVRSYQVGFGDCFLVTFIYKTVERHVLIDFGSTGKPHNPTELEGTLKSHLQRVANHIAQTCGGKLEAVIASHRHKDHISGFDTNVGPGQTIRDLDPEIVIQPWTEHPDADPDAESLGVLDPDEVAFAAGLRRMNDIASSAIRLSQLLKRRPALRSAIDAGLIAELGFLGETNLRNASAVANLMTMGQEQRYLSYGHSSGVTLSGVKVHVLGPPTLAQYREIASQRSADDEEFWMLRAVEQHRPSMVEELALFEGFERDRHDPSTAWLRKRLQRAGVNERLEIVRRLDDALNNTSVIVLFEVGDQKLLFPGDAQIENWEWALKEAPDKDDNLDLLRDVTVYKCGHHGSRNATPKTLWENFGNRSTQTDAPSRLKTFISTAEGKHGHHHNNSEVPRETLVEAFRNETDMQTTETVDANSDVPFLETVLTVT